MDRYSSYHELKEHEKEGEDYVIFSREGRSNIIIIAHHGGGIEPGTVDIADGIAGEEHSFYAFKGLKKIGNSILHITSKNFDEPIGLVSVEKADIAVSIHGYDGKDERVLIGGTNYGLQEKILFMLKEEGFDAEIIKTASLGGRDTENICNRCRTGKGVQLEISRGLREKMFFSLSKRSYRFKTGVFYKFVNTLREVISSH